MDKILYETDNSELLDMHIVTIYGLINNNDVWIG
jgi:hypothetical protein